MNQIFPVLSIILSIAAAGFYLWNRDIAHASYWMLGAVSTAVVTFCLGGRA